MLANNDASLSGTHNPANDDGGDGLSDDGVVEMDSSTVSPSKGTTGKGRKTAKSDAQTHSEESQTLEEVSYSSRQFQGVKTPYDLATLEYCAAKLLSAICKLKDGKEGNPKKAICEEGMMVQIRIKKNDVAANREGGRHQATR